MYFFCLFNLSHDLNQHLLALTMPWHWAKPPFQIQVHCSVPQSPQLQAELLTLEPSLSKPLPHLASRVWKLH